MDLVAFLSTDVLPYDELIIFNPLFLLLIPRQVIPDNVRNILQGKVVFQNVNIWCYALKYNLILASTTTTLNIKWYHFWKDTYAQYLSCATLVSYVAFLKAMVFQLLCSNIFADFWRRMSKNLNWLLTVLWTCRKPPCKVTEIIKPPPPPIKKLYSWPRWYVIDIGQCYLFSEMVGMVLALDKIRYDFKE